MSIERRMIETERKYGGRTRKYDVPPSKHGANPDTACGGDRFGPDGHGYESAYADVFDGWTPSVIVEIGVLEGHGLRLWSELFPDARVLGFDIQPELCAPDLECHYLDQHAPDPQLIWDALGNDDVDLVIDDGCHVDSATLATFDAFRIFMASDWRYVIEDRPKGSRIHELVHDLHGVKAHRLHPSLTLLMPCR